MFSRQCWKIVTLGALLTCACGAALKAQAPVMPPAPPSPPASEQITSYNSDLTVGADNVLRVTETIRVFSLGQQIKDELCRRILTSYHDRLGNPYTIHIEVLSVEEDGQPSDFHLERVPDGLRICMGKSGQMLARGEHTFELNYVVDREIGFFPDHDELYWNVTGYGWNLPIADATATVHLPKGIAREAILVDGYTGPPGSANTNFTASADNQSAAAYHTTQPLGPHEGLAIVTRWPKNFVSPPTDAQKHQYFLEDNQPTLIGMMGLGLLLLYYVAAWFVVQKFHGEEDTAPRSDPPWKFSPALLRYLWRGSFDRKTMVANLVDLAVKKKLAILENADGAFILGRLPPGTASAGTAVSPPASADEKLVLKKLFATSETLSLERASHRSAGAAIEALHLDLRLKGEAVYLLAESPYLALGLLISLLTAVRSGFAIQGVEKSLLLASVMGSTVCTLCFLVLLELTISAWRCTLSDPLYPVVARQQTMLITGVSLVFLMGAAVAFGAVAWTGTTGVAVILAVLLFFSALFHALVKSPARAARRLMDQIEAFRVFLSTSAADRRGKSPTKIDPAEFEKLLPYAMALNVEKIWGEKFAAALTQGTRGGTINYSPAWYTGLGWNPITAATFVTTLGSSLSSAIGASLVHN